MTTEMNEPQLPPAPTRARRGRPPKAEAVAVERPLDNQNEVEEAPRVRATRAEATQRERRRRGSNDATSDMKLGFRFKPDPNYEYRWINHGVDGQRIKDKTIDDDWDMVSSEGEQTSDVGTALRRAVGQNASGPIYSYLCRKPKDWHEADQRQKQERNDRMMEHIRGGKSPMDISTRGQPGKGLSQSDNVYGAEGISLQEHRTRS